MHYFKWVCWNWLVLQIVRRPAAKPSPAHPREPERRVKRLKMASPNACCSRTLCLIFGTNQSKEGGVGRGEVSAAGGSTVHHNNGGPAIAWGLTRSGATPRHRALSLDETWNGMNGGAAMVNSNIYAWPGQANPPTLPRQQAFVAKLQTLDSWQHELENGTKPGDVCTLLQRTIT